MSDLTTKGSAWDSWVRPGVEQPTPHNTYQASGVKGTEVFKRVARAAR